MFTDILQTKENIELFLHPRGKSIVGEPGVFIAVKHVGLFFGRCLGGEEHDRAVHAELNALLWISQNPLSGVGDFLWNPHGIAFR